MTWHLLSIRFSITFFLKPLLCVYFLIKYVKENMRTFFWKALTKREPERQRKMRKSNVGQSNSVERHLCQKEKLSSGSVVMY